MGPNFDTTAHVRVFCHSGEQQRNTYIRCLRAVISYVKGTRVIIIIAVKNRPGNTYEHVATVSQQ